MNPETIREFCLAFPQATEKLQWSDELCFKIGEKIFVMMGLDNPRLCFKCAPDTFTELIEREDIRPAPYVGRYKWVMMDRLDAVEWAELQQLIGQSYEMVAKNAVKSGGTKAAKKKPRRKSPQIRKARKSLPGERNQTGRDSKSGTGRA